MNCRLFSWYLFAGLLALTAIPPVRAQFPQRAPTPNDRLQSPEVLADGRIAFRIYAPQASEVTITGDWIAQGLGSGGNLTKDDQGVWSIEVGPLPADLYSYAFLVDGVKTLDPKNPEIKPGIRSADNMFFVVGPESDFEDQKEVPHGDIRKVWYRSSTLGVQRRMHVYTPPGYDQQDARYPVLYLLHGGGDEDSGWSTIGRAGFILDNLIAAGKAQPTLIVMPNGSLPPVEPPAGETSDAQRASRRRASQDRFTRELMSDVIPLVESQFRVRADAASRAIAGLSMGGGQTLRVMTTHPDAFTYYAIWSAGLFRPASDDAESPYADFLSDADQRNAQIRLLSICVGDQDFALDGSQALAALLKEHGIRHELHVSGGGHTWINWRRYLHDYLPRLFQETSTPAAPADDSADKTEEGEGEAEADEGSESDAAATPAGFDQRREQIERGKVDVVQYPSTTVGNDRTMLVYTPPGYTEQETYPALYLLHGIGDDETGWQKLGAADVILDNLYADGRIVPMVVVMPNGRAQENDRPGGDFRGQFPAFERFEEDLIRDVIPFIEGHYSVKSDRSHRALAGLSMGGGQALNFGLRHLDLFGWVGAFSAAPNTLPASELVPDPQAAREALSLLWISCGDSDRLMDVSQAFHRTLSELQVPHEWHIDTGGHTWDVWKNDLFLFSQRLFR
jgi:enterochelin esterase family protein